MNLTDIRFQARYQFTGDKNHQIFFTPPTRGVELIASGVTREDAFRRFHEFLEYELKRPFKVTQRDSKIYEVTAA